MSLSRLRKVSGRWWGNLRKQKHGQQNGDDISAHENEHTKTGCSGYNSLHKMVHKTVAFFHISLIL